MSKFVGSYINDMTEVLIASAVSGVHALFIGAPGWGKTDVQYAAARNIAGADRFIYLEFTSGTKPSAVEGMWDIPALVQTGQVRLNQDNTARDQRARIVVTDEAGRANDPTWDALIHAMKRVDLSPNERPVFWGNTNFMPESDRTQALRERFGIWYRVTPNGVSWEQIGAVTIDGIGEDLELQGLPDWDTVAAIRAARPGGNARAAILQFVADLQDAAAAEQTDFGFSPRHMRHWTHVLFRMGMLETGQDDFGALPSRATSLVRYMLPTTDGELAAKWEQVVAAIADVLGAKVSALRQATFDAFKAARDRVGLADRMRLAVELAGIQQARMTELYQLGGNDPRVEAAVNEIQEVCASLSRGEDPFSH